VINHSLLKKSKYIQKLLVLGILRYDNQRWLACLDPQSLHDVGYLLVNDSNEIYPLIYFNKREHRRKLVDEDSLRYLEECIKCILNGTVNK
jgi:hypothetical protein